MNHALLKIVASAALGHVPTGADAAFPEWEGPDSTIVRVQATLYASLSTTLLAAFVAMLGKQWLKRYASVRRGSVIDRCRQRKGRMDGMMTWKFGPVVECIPLMLQAALILLGYALYSYLLFVNRVVASVVIGFLTFGLLFYFLIVAAGTLSCNCPFQTPLSLILRFFIRFDNQHRGYLKRSMEWFGCILSRMKQQQKQKPGDPKGSEMFGASSRNSVGEHIELAVGDPPRVFDQGANEGCDAYPADSDCVAWMFERPMDIDVTVAMARFIPEITWDDGTTTIPLRRLHDALFKCFDHSFEGAILKQPLRDHAYFIAKALIHVGIQRKCIDDKTIFPSIASWHPRLGSRHMGDPELEATLNIIDHITRGFEPIQKPNFSFTIPHHAWMGHILLHIARDTLEKGKLLPNYIWDFVLYSLRMEPSPPKRIIADCLFIIGLVLGIELNINDLLVNDKG